MVDSSDVAVVIFVLMVFIGALIHYLIDHILGLILMIGGTLGVMGMSFVLAWVLLEETEVR